MLKNFTYKSPILFVLGAGFTKAFDERAPLLKFNIHLNYLKRHFKSIPNIYSLLETIKPDKDNLVNFEDILSRLYSGMPYDNNVILEEERKLLMNKVLDFFQKKLIDLKPNDSNKKDALHKFAKFIIDNKASCITFNYDDLLDQELYEYSNSSEASHQSDKINIWSPVTGYGFHLENVEPPAHLPVKMHTMLLKMHGSVSWFPKFGTPKPYNPDSLIQLATWYPLPHIFKEDIKYEYEYPPFMIPPIVDKSIMYEYPILKIIWTRAYELLQEAKTVVFLGYSMPMTDLAGKFLFKETLAFRNLKNVVVVNRYPEGIKSTEREEEREKKEKSYREIFKYRKFRYDGTVEWINKYC